MIDVLFTAAIAMSSPALSPADTTVPVLEDDPSWSCVDMGNHICGPGNSNGVPAGRYDEGGVLVDVWPVA